MGQKVHPYVLRIGFAKTWQSLWFSPRKREFAAFLEEDVKIRRGIQGSYPKGSIAGIIIERVSSEGIRIKIRTSRPGVIIGRRGGDIEKVKARVEELTAKNVKIDVEEVSEPALEARLISEQIAFQLMKRVHFRRAMKKSIANALSNGCQGIKIRCSGRLGGAEIARSEVYKQGKVPLQTFRSDMDYAYTIAKTTYGTIGIKVWVYKGEAPLGEYLNKEDKKSEKDSKLR